MAPVLHRKLPADLWADPRLGRLPGTGPVAPGDWLRVDEAFAGQMAERDRLLAQQIGAVMQALPTADAPARELLGRVLDELAGLPGYRIGPDTVMRPDGISVPLTGPHPLAVLGRLCQEDFCILQKVGDAHVLTGAVLCFPASWSLAEKLGKPLMAIHSPVQPYTPEVGRRVQRLFDLMRAETPLTRVNLLRYDTPDLFQPRRADDRRKQPEQAAAFVRSERQCLVRLPECGAVVFSIHSYVARIADLCPEQAAQVRRCLDAH